MAEVAEPRTLPDGKICDFIDMKVRNDTPEEYVRQNIERRLVVELGYSPEDLEVEFPIKLFSKTVRVDLAIFKPGEPHAPDTVRVIIECKKDSVPPSAQKDGVGQLKAYMAVCQNAEWGMWTNGKQKAVYRKIASPDGIAYEEPNDIPRRDGSPEEVDRPTRDRLISATADNMLFTFKICHDHIYVTDGLHKQDAFFEFLKVIFCKISDEKNFAHPLQFYATAKEKMSNDGRLTVTNRIGKIFEAVKKKYPSIFEANDTINLQPRSLAYIVGELQRYSFIDTGIDVKGKAYEEIVGANLRGDRGEFFTPRNVQKMCVTMLDLKADNDELFLDPTCGTGGFLVIAMNQIIDQLMEQRAGGGAQTEAMRVALAARVQEVAAARFFGIDINPSLVKATKMNMVMNNDGSGNILRQDSLLHPHQWEESFKRDLAKAVGIDARAIRGPNDIALFDVIATNPPFGAKLPIKDTETLKQFRLGYVWRETDDGRWEQTDKLRSGESPEVLFIERCWQFLKPGGRMAIVLPDSILGAPGNAHVREWMMQCFRIVSSVDLHPDTFQPRNGTQTSVLLLQKKSERELSDEAKAKRPRDYEIFMAEVRAIGHDKRGNPVYVRDEDGEEIWFPPETGARWRIDASATGATTGRALPMEKRRDDETGAIAAEFLEWKESAVLGW